MSIFELRGGDELCRDIELGDAGALGETCDFEMLECALLWLMMEEIPTLDAEGGERLCEGRILDIGG
jgi:hypothetical protein